MSKEKTKATTAAAATQCAIDVFPLLKDFFAVLSAQKTNSVTGAMALMVAAAIALREFDATQKETIRNAAEALFDIMEELKPQSGDDDAAH